MRQCYDHYVTCCKMEVNWFCCYYINSIYPSRNFFIVLLTTVNHEVNIGAKNNFTKSKWTVWFTVDCVAPHFVGSGCVCVWVCVCMHACVRVCMRMCVCVCMEGWQEWSWINWQTERAEMTELLAVGETCKAWFWPTAGFRQKTFDSSGFSWLERTLSSASMVPTKGWQQVSCLCFRVSPKDATSTVW